MSGRSRIDPHWGGAERVARRTASCSPCSAGTTRSCRRSGRSDTCDSRARGVHGERKPNHGNGNGRCGVCVCVRVCRSCLGTVCAGHVYTNQAAHQHTSTPARPPLPTLHGPVPYPTRPTLSSDQWGHLYSISPCIPYLHTSDYTPMTREHNEHSYGKREESVLTVCTSARLLAGLHTSTYAPAAALHQKRST